MGWERSRERRHPISRIDRHPSTWPQVNCVPGTWWTFSELLILYLIVWYLVWSSAHPTWSSDMARIGTNFVVSTEDTFSHA